MDRHPVAVGREAFRVRFVAKGEFEPTQPGAGPTSPVTEALFAGTFVIVPE